MLDHGLRGGADRIAVADVADHPEPAIESEVVAAAARAARPTPPPSCSLRATAAPMPPLAPVISATFPSISMVSSVRLVPHQPKRTGER